MAHGKLYDARQKLKIAFLSVSVLLVALFLVISNRLVEDLSTEERNKMEIWAEATPFGRRRPVGYRHEPRSENPAKQHDHTHYHRRQPKQYPANPQPRYTRPAWRAIPAKEAAISQRKATSHRNLHR